MSSARLAALVVDVLVRNGVRDAVLCPGSRNAPLAYALHRADELRRLRLHVRVDERSAGFLALGLSAVSGRPVPVATTSGTAAANLHPAVLEASHQGVPLVALTADRPPALVGTGANQTTDQAHLYGRAARWYAGLDSLDPDAATAAVARALGWATGALSQDPGPVQVNLAFREPLVEPPLDVETVPTRLPDPDRFGSDAGPLPVARTLLVAGGAATPWSAQAAETARRHGWPVIAELSAGLGAAALAHGSLVLDDELPQPDRVVVVGTPTLHRPVQRLLGRGEVVVVAGGPRWPDAARRATQVVHPGWLRRLAAEPPATDTGFTAVWADAAQRAATAVDETLRWPDGPAVARTVHAALPPDAVLQAGSSNAVRDLDLGVTPRDDVRVLANRGLAGIDGTLASAAGAALALGRPTYALVGDLTFAHDLNGLLAGPAEPDVDLTVVVMNDGGGGIFATLEQGADDAPAGFERLFGTATRASIADLAAGVGAAYRRCDHADTLAAALRTPPQGLTVVEVTLDRSTRRERDERLRAAVRAAVRSR